MDRSNGLVSRGSFRCLAPRPVARMTALESAMPDSTVWGWKASFREPARGEAAVVGRPVPSWKAEPESKAPSWAAKMSAAVGRRVSSW